MTTKEQIQIWIDQGFQLLQDGKPIKVEGNIWDYIHSIDTSNNTVLVLREVINWEEEELTNLTISGIVTEK